MQYQSQGGWSWYMSVGGPVWDSKDYNYQLEEVALGIGYPFSF